MQAWIVPITCILIIRPLILSVICQRGESYSLRQMLNLKCMKYSSYLQSWICFMQISFNFNVLHQYKKSLQQTIKIFSNDTYTHYSNIFPSSKYVCPKNYTILWSVEPSKVKPSYFDQYVLGHVLNVDDNHDIATKDLRQARDWWTCHKNPSILFCLFGRYVSWDFIYAPLFVFFLLLLSSQRFHKNVLDRPRRRPNYYLDVALF